LSVPAAKLGASAKQISDNDEQTPLTEPKKPEIPKYFKSEQHLEDFFEFFAAYLKRTS
jgi:hypothetical protein